MWRIVEDLWGIPEPRRGQIGTATGRRPGGGRCIAPPTSSPMTKESPIAGCEAFPEEMLGPSSEKL